MKNTLWGAIQKFNLIGYLTVVLLRLLQKKK